MTRSPGSMDHIHRLLNCAYANYDASDYVGSFMAQRAADLAAVTSDAAIFDCNADALDADSIFSFICTHNPAFSSPPGPLQQGFATFHVMGYALLKLTADRALESPLDEIVSILQKRFEVNHRLFTRYDGTIRKSGDDYTNMRVYALCAIVFIKLFLLKHNFSYLNTAIKLNDMVLKCGWPIECQDLPFVRAAVVLEQKIILGEYEKYNS